jgi:hypothetical protein
LLTDANAPRRTAPRREKNQIRKFRSVAAPRVSQITGADLE